MKKTFTLLILSIFLSSCTIAFGSYDSANSVDGSISDDAPISISNDTSISIEIPTSDPYIDVTRKEFYESYTPALSYQEANYRSEHGFMSGDITPQQQIPADNTNLPKDSQNHYYRISDANYTYDEQGNYLSYTTNKIDGSKGTTIFYGGAYTSLEEVAAYLLAFGEVPPNSNYYKEETDDAISEWGEYGRVNKSEFTNDTKMYKYEPSLAEVASKNYIETDFGTTGYKCGEGFSSAPYNDGKEINRGAARLCFTSTYKYGERNSKIEAIEERHVFYTYNHYNDFQEYLNYEGGWGEIFGFQTAGNDYCSGRKEYANWEEQGKVIIPPTQYVTVTPISLSKVAK